MTLTPELHPLFSAGFLLLLVAFAVLELWGVLRRGTGDTFTEAWRWAAAQLPTPLRWLFRVFTAGLLVWALLHFLVGAE